MMNPLILFGFFTSNHFQTQPKCLSQDLRSSGCGCPFLKTSSWLGGWVSKINKLPAGVSGITQFFKHHSHLYGGLPKPSPKHFVEGVETSPVYYSSKTLYLCRQKSEDSKNKTNASISPHKSVGRVYITLHFFWVLFFTQT